MSEWIHSPAVIALELGAQQALPRQCLEREESEQLATLLAEDLARVLPDVVRSDLLVLGGLFDQAQLLRPAWPLYGSLAELAERGLAGDGQRRIIAFGAHQGMMPVHSMQPESRIGGGTLLLLPWMLRADTGVAATLADAMEREFVARGELGPRVADFLMRTLDVRFEHARYLTRNDVCALACVQLEHVGLSALWQLLETALLSPEASSSSVSTRGRAWHYHAHIAHTDMPDFAAWLRAHGHALDVAERAHAYAGWLFELRQYAALLDAHGLAWVAGAGAAGAPLIQALDETDPDAAAPELIAHEAPGLGIVVIGVVQWRANVAQVLALAYPLRAEELPPLLSELGRRYAAGPLRRLGRLALDTTGSALRWDS